MIKYILMALLLTCFCRAEQLDVKYEPGWGVGYSLQVNLSNGRVRYLPLTQEADREIQAKIENAVNTGEYLRALLQRLERDEVGVRGDDVAKYTINFQSKTFTKKLVIWNISPPNSIFLNPERSAKAELVRVDDFKEKLDAYLVELLITAIVEHVKSEASVTPSK